jgi:flagellar hook-length control protein FliK
MSLVENLLLNIDPKNTKTKPANEGNFLLTLLDSYKNEPDKLCDILKNLNINENDLKNLEEKFNKILSTKNKKYNLTKDSLNTLLESLKFKLQSTKTTQENLHKKNPNIKNSSEEISDILKYLLNNPVISNDKLEKIIKDTKNSSEKNTIQNIDIKNIQNIDIKIVEITKKAITSTKILEKLKLSDKEIQEFKEIKSFKELINFANKKDLNISKIILSYNKSNISNQTGLINKEQTFLPKQKIELKTSNKNKLSQTKKTNITSKNILTSLIKNNNTFTKKETARHIKSDFDILNTNESEKQSNIKSFANKDNDKTELNLKKDLPELKTNNNSNIQNPQTVTMLKTNILKAKESLKHFASNLKEAVENYKPPISKLSMELHPKELGKVEVTLVHRGDNLQIQINSNNTAISFFHSTQQELRQNLINMGFTDVNMSFNQNQQQGNKEYRQNQKFSKNDEEYDEMIIEIPYQYA